MRWADFTAFFWTSRQFLANLLRIFHIRLLEDPLRDFATYAQSLLLRTILVCIGITGISAIAQDAAPIIKPGAPGEPSKAITAEDSLALGQSYFTQHDVKFMQDMIVHHAQAIEMSALIDGRSSSPQIALLGKRITLSQTSEIEMMRTWLRRRGAETESEMAHDHHAGAHDMPAMVGMLSPNQMAELAAASGSDFDRLFLTGMILHHQGALIMVDALMLNERSGEDPELSSFIASIKADQSAEILRMSAMLEKQ